MRGEKSKGEERRGEERRKVRRKGKRTIRKGKQVPPLVHHRVKSRMKEEKTTNMSTVLEGTFHLPTMKEVTSSQVVSSRITTSHSTCRTAALASDIVRSLEGKSAHQVFTLP